MSCSPLAPVRRRGRLLPSLLPVAVLLAALFNGPALPRASAQEASAALPAPELSQPDDGRSTADTTPTFVWRSLRGAESYLFELARDPGFGDVVIRTEPRSRTQAVRDRLPAGTYFWRVAARDAAGRAGAWSAVWSFTITGNAPTPAPTAPPAAPTEPPAAPTEAPTQAPTERPTEAPTQPTQAPTQPQSTTAPAPAATAPTQPTQASDGQPVSAQSLLPPTEGYRIAGSGRTGNSVTSSVVYDRNMGTVWTTVSSTIPRSGYVYVQIGAVKPIGKIRWVFGQTGLADAMKIEVSNDRTKWKSVGSFGNAPEGVWQEITVTVNARYVRWYFTNPNKEAKLGGLAEVEVWPQGSTAAPPPTATPTQPTSPTGVTPEADTLIANASFESGNANWYLEGAAGASSANPHGGAQAMELGAGGGLADQRVPLQSGNSYDLTVWGKLTASGDSASVGVTYWDANGTRLRSDEPASLTFSGTTWTKKTLTFAPGANVARVNVYAYKEGGAAVFAVDDFRLTISSSPAPAPTATSAPSTSVGSQRMLVPSYFYPDTGNWDAAIAQAPAVAMLVLNPNSGVDSSKDPIYDDPIRRAQAAGIRVLGYIQTDYGARSAASVKAEIDLYRAWYGVTSFFLDEAATGSGSIANTKAMVDYIHGLGGIAVLNFGWTPDEGYMAFTDVAVVFEDTYNAYLNNYNRPSWFNNYPAARFAHIIIETPASNMQDAFTKAKQRNAGYVWVTDDTLPSPFNSLPSYWSSAVSAASSS